MLSDGDRGMESPGDLRARRIVAAALAAFGVALLVLVHGGPPIGEYYRLRPWVDHPWVFAAAGWYLLVAACAVGVRGRMKWVGIGLFAAAGWLVVAVGYLGSVFVFDLPAQSRQLAPDGRMELIVYRSSAAYFPDPTRELRVRTQEGLLSRESDLGCVNLDSNRLHSIQWTGPRTLRAHLARERIVDVTLDEHGRPDRKIDGGC